MERFLNKKIVITTVTGSNVYYVGVLTSFDDEYVCLDNSTYVVRKFILSIKIK